MLFLQCVECGFRTVSGALELGGPCPRCVRRGDAVGWRLSKSPVRRREVRAGIWSGARVEWRCRRERR